MKKLDFLYVLQTNFSGCSKRYAATNFVMCIVVASDPVTCLTNGTGSLLTIVNTVKFIHSKQC